MRLLIIYYKNIMIFLDGINKFNED